MDSVVFSRFPSKSAQIRPNNGGSPIASRRHFNLSAMPASHEKHVDGKRSTPPGFRKVVTGRFIKNPGFSRSISNIIFCVADFHAQFQRFFAKGRSQ
jgi:hypothetical protein